MIDSSTNVERRLDVQDEDYRERQEDGEDQVERGGEFSAPALHEVADLWEGAVGELQGFVSCGFGHVGVDEAGAAVEDRSGRDGRVEPDGKGQENGDAGGHYAWTDEQTNKQTNKRGRDGQGQQQLQQQ